MGSCQRSHIITKRNEVVVTRITTALLPRRLPVLRTTTPQTTATTAVPLYKKFWTKVTITMPFWEYPEKPLPPTLPKRIEGEPYRRIPTRPAAIVGRSTRSHKHTIVWATTKNATCTTDLAFRELQQIVERTISRRRIYLICFNNRRNSSSNDSIDRIERFVTNCKSVWKICIREWPKM